MHATRVVLTVSFLALFGPAELLANHGRTAQRELGLTENGESPKHVQQRIDLTDPQS